MNFKEIIFNVIVPLISGILGGSISSIVIIKNMKQKQINKNESFGVQIGEINVTKKQKR